MKNLVLLFAAACAAAPFAKPLPHLPAVDAHCDITQDITYMGYDFSKRHTVGDHHEDLPRDREGGLSAQIFSVWVDPDQFPRERWFAEAERQMSGFPRVDGLALVRTAREVRENTARGVMSGMFGVEGGHALWPGTPDEQLQHLRRFAELGARYMTLTWSNSNDIGGSSSDDGRVRGLTDFGRRVLDEMQRLGVVIDLSHVSDPLFWDAIRYVHKPVIASHSSARQLANVPRNLTDAQLEAIAKNGGAACVNFFPGFLDAATLEEIRALEKQIDARVAPRKLTAIEREQILRKEFRTRVTLGVLADHILHMVQVAGIDHVCLGSDFDGISTTPVGLEDATKLPNLAAELLRRGLTEADVRKIFADNLLRVLEANE